MVFWPGWLARKGYLISYLDAEAEGQMIELFAPKQIPTESVGLESYDASEITTHSTVVMVKVVPNLQKHIDHL